MIMQVLRRLKIDLAGFSATQKRALGLQKRDATF